jgi:hypothetical protein
MRRDSELPMSLAAESVLSLFRSVSYSFPLPHLNVAGGLITFVPPPATGNCGSPTGGQPEGGPQRLLFKCVQKNPASSKNPEQCQYWQEQECNDGNDDKDSGPILH